MTVLADVSSGTEDIKTVDIEKIEAECEVRYVDTTTHPQSSIIDEKLELLSDPAPYQILSSRVGWWVVL